MIDEKKVWTAPNLVVYGDVATLTEVGTCDPLPVGCNKPKRLGLGDDFDANISTVF